MRITSIAALALGASLFVTPALAEVIHYTASLDGASETPWKATKGTGSADVTLDTTTKLLSWTISYKDLSGPATKAHFHGPAPVGKAAGVTVPITGPMKSPLVGSATLNDGQIGDLRGGLWYVNIHTAQNPGGEIRGQILKAH